MVVFPTIVFFDTMLHFSYENRVKFAEIERDWREMELDSIAWLDVISALKVAPAGGFRRDGVVYPLTGRLLSLQNK